MATSSVIGLDIGGTSAKMSEYIPGKEEIATIAKLHLEPGDWTDEENLTRKVSEWVLEKKQLKKNRFVLGWPGARAVIRIQNPPTQELNKEEWSLWEMQKYLPDPPEDYITDFHQQQKSSRLALSVRKKNLESMVKNLAKAGLNLSTVDADIFATWNCFELNYPESAAGKTLLLKADSPDWQWLYSVEGILISTARLKMLPEFSTLEGELQNSTLEKAVEKIRESLSRQKLDTENLTGAFCCGDLAANSAMHQSLEEVFSRKFEILDAFKKIRFPHDPQLEEKVKETSPQCFTAVGLSLRTGSSA